ncbi:putative axial regulator YABBY 2 [Senna tora]|uniref:Putative axial regulator YABBY 2 n=1 Tax=Senna tora TaxID=362788 RepID=A0A834SYE8_9FABA|nr:putative axial regulator YABBY 2 [Senna tora]
MMAASLQPFPTHQDYPHQNKQHLNNNFEESSNKEHLGSSSSSSKSNKLAPFESVDQHEQPRIPPIRPPEKRQRVPSAYNRFIK